MPTWILAFFLKAMQSKLIRTILAVLPLGLSVFLWGRSSGKLANAKQEVKEYKDYIIIGEQSEKIRNTVTQLDDADVDKRLSENGWFRK